VLRRLQTQAPISWSKRVSLGSPVKGHKSTAVSSGKTNTFSGTNICMFPEIRSTLLMVMTAGTRGTPFTDRFNKLIKLIKSTNAFAAGSKLSIKKDTYYRLSVGFPRARCTENITDEDRKHVEVVYGCVKFTGRTRPLDEPVSEDDHNTTKEWKSFISKTGNGKSATSTGLSMSTLYEVVQGSFKDIVISTQVRTTSDKQWNAPGNVPENTKVVILKKFSSIEAMTESVSWK